MQEERHEEMRGTAAAAAEGTDKSEKIGCAGWHEPDDKPLHVDRTTPRTDKKGYGIPRTQRMNNKGPHRPNRGIMRTGNHSLACKSSADRWLTPQAGKSVYVLGCPERTFPDN